MKSRAATTVIAGLTALLAVTGCYQSADGEPTASAIEVATHITSAGPTFAASMTDNRFAVYGKDHADLSLGYDSVGSGNGIDRLLAGNVDIGTLGADAGVETGLNGAFNLARVVERPPGCVPRGSWLGTTRRNGRSIPTRCQRPGAARGVPLWS